MGRRRDRVEENLRRALSDVILFGKLRDPRLADRTQIGITYVRVTADLSIARVFVDPLTAAPGRFDEVLAGLQAAAGAIRRELGALLSMRRVPELRFLRDESIERGLAIERVLDEIRGPGENSGDGP